MYSGINNVKDIVEYLVLRRLISDITTVLLLKEYFVDGNSPSDISRKYSISAHTVRGYVERLIEKAGSPHIIPGIIKRVLPYIMNIEPLIIIVSGKYYCLECEITLSNKQAAINHIKRRHRDKLNRIVNEVLTKIKQQSRY